MSEHDPPPRPRAAVRLDETRLPAENCGGGVDEGVQRAERDALLHRAVRQLPPRQQLPLRLLAADPPPSYREISAATGIPIGSVGPTRARARQRGIGSTSPSRR